MPKRLRQRRILDLATEEPLLNQKHLRRRLAQHGIRVTQATLSRDLRELGLAKTPQGYTLPAAAEAATPPAPSLPHVLQEFVLDVRQAQHLLVLKTGPGNAHPVAAVLDRQRWSDVVGTVAGDDTILVITPSRKACQRITERIRELMV